MSPLLVLFLITDIFIDTGTSILTEFDKFPCVEFCDSVVCEKLTVCPKGFVVSDSTYCNCCSTCVQVLNEKDDCEDATTFDSLQDFNQPQCKTGLKCINGKCTFADPNNSCLQLRQTLQVQKGNALYADDIWIPECDEEGNFQPKQQKKIKSHCMKTFQERLFGQEESELSENMTCACSIHVNKMQTDHPHTYLTQPEEHCSSNGNFEPLQCIGEICYCADPMSGRVEGRPVKMAYMNKLPCYDAETYDDGYLKSCEKELLKTKSLRLEFHWKGVDVFGLEQLECDPDGSFSSRQCDLNDCVCTNRDGVGIRSYYIGIGDFQKLQEEMTCNCARDVETTSSYAQRPSLHCKGYGNYMLFQCFDKNQCFCVDVDGDVITKVLNKSIASEDFCTKLFINLYKIPGKITEVTTTIDDDYDDYDY